MAKHEYVHAIGLPRRQEAIVPHVMVNIRGPKNGIGKTEALSLESAKTLIRELTNAVKRLEQVI